jgi:copper homeostasis protein
MSRILEVCTGSLGSVMAAAEGGAERIELCSALPLDGLTPSFGLLSEVRHLFPYLRIHVLIRPREGNFVYDDAELRIMERDIEAALPYADAIVSGALTEENEVDLKATQRLIKASGNRSFTFHRAFDACRDPHESLERLIGLGCHRVLTSGQASTAEEGIGLLRELVRQANGRITILPGGGVNARNARMILDETGASEIHGSASAVTPEGIKMTSAREVAQILKSIQG